MTNKVPDNISWDNLCLSMAFLISCKSHDTRTKVGCVAMLDSKELFMGYNGGPSDFNDALLATDLKHSIVLHAEHNCLNQIGLERARQQKNLTIYTTFRPCPNCALILVHFNVKRVVYFSDYKSKVNDDNLLELIRKRGYIYGEYAFSLEKYSGDLLFKHEHMGL